MSLDATVSPSSLAAPISPVCAGQTSTALSVAAVTTRDEVLELQDAWLALEHASRGTTVFQSFALCLAWLDTYVFCERPTHEARILVFSAPEKGVLAIAPLAKRKSGWFNMAEWLGEPLIQYGDILLDPICDTQALRLAFSAALDDWDVGGLVLRNVRADARIHHVLDLNTTSVGQVRQAASVDLTGFDEAEAYFATFSKRSKKNRKTKRRKLADKGSLSFEAVKAGPRAGELCALALEWKKTWLAQRGLSSRAFMDDRALSVLTEMCGSAQPHNPVELFVQKVDGAPVAIEVGLVGPQGNIAFMGTYDPAYEALSAGKVQMESSIVHGFDQGWAGYDMLAPLTEYKQSWSTTLIDVADHVVPTGVAGLVYRDGYLRMMRPALKAFWSVLPRTVRTRLVSGA